MPLHIRGAGRGGGCPSLHTLLLAVSLLAGAIAYSAAAAAPSSSSSSSDQDAQPVFSSLRSLLEGSSSSSNPGHGQRAQSCRASFEPTCDLYPYLRYWNRRFTERDCQRSPLRHPLGALAPVSERKYVVFEPDCAQWNNIRMAAEVSIIFALATGRTLVVPPMIMHHLHVRSGQPQPFEDQEKVFGGASSFFDFKKISELIDVITMDEFLLTVAGTGLLNKSLPDYPIAELTQFKLRELWDYFKATGHWREWNPEKMFIVFNLSPPGRAHISNSLMESIHGTDTGDTDNVTRARFNPVVHDARLEAFAVHKDPDMIRRAVPYDAAFHAHRVVYFPGTHDRVLATWYTYLYWQSLAQEKLYKRVARDRLRAGDDLFCAAGRVVRLIHEDSAALANRTGRRVLSGVEEAAESVPQAQARRLAGALHPVAAEAEAPGGGEELYRMMPQAGRSLRVDKSQMWAQQLDQGRGVVQPASRASAHTLGGDVRSDATYHALHIRRGDFQVSYKDTIQSGDDLFKNVSPLLNRSVTRLLYIATDEKERSYFQKFEELYEVRYLSDYVDRAGLQPFLTKHVHMGTIEQLVCANAHTFVGTPLSTFSAYITRLRGFYRDGRYSNTYYSTPGKMYQLQKRGVDLYAPFWARDWPNAHLNIDEQDKV